MISARGAGCQINQMIHLTVLAVSHDPQYRTQHWHQKEPRVLVEKSQWPRIHRKEDEEAVSRWNDLSEIQTGYQGEDCHLGLVIPRRTRKELFRLRLWRPARDRVVPAPSRPTAPPVAAVAVAVGSGGGLSGLKLATWNVQSLGNKFLDVANTIVAHDLDILVVTES